MSDDLEISKCIKETHHAGRRVWVIKGVPDIFDSKEHAINFAKLIDRDMSRQELGPVPMDRQWEAELRGIDLEGEKEAEQASAITQDEMHEWPDEYRPHVDEEKDESTAAVSRLAKLLQQGIEVPKINPASERGTPMQVKQIIHGIEIEL